MEVEHVSWVRLTSWRTTQEERNAAVRNGVLREVVVNHESVLALVHEVLAERHARVRSKERHRSWLRSSRGNDDGVIHRAELLQALNYLHYRRALLADRHVDADYSVALLVDDRVDRNGGLAGLLVTDDQLALSAADWRHGVNRLDAGLHRLVNRLAAYDARGLDLKTASLGSLDVAEAVDWVAERIDNAADHRLANRHAGDLASALDGVAFLNGGCLSHYHHAHVVLFEVQRDSLGAVGELNELAEGDLAEAVGAGNSVTDAQNGANLGEILVAGGGADLVLDDPANLICTYVHVYLVSKKSLVDPPCASNHPNVLDQ